MDTRLLDREDVAPLLTALNDPDCAVSLAALKALVTLPLSNDAWQPVCYHMMDLLHETDAPGQAVIDAAIQVPAGMIRERLRELLHSDDPVTREASALALAQAHEPAARATLLRILTSDTNADEPLDLRERAAEAITYLDCTDVVNELDIISRGDPCGEVRIFAALAQGNCGDLSSVMTFLESPHDDMRWNYCGDPSILEERIRRCSRIPEPQQDNLKRIAENEHLDDYMRQLAYAMIPTSENDFEDYVAERIDVSDAQRIAAASAARVIDDKASFDVNAFRTMEPDDPDTIAWLAPGGATKLATTLVQKAAASPDTIFESGNWIVCHLSAVREPFLPDIEALFQSRGDMNEDQLAWLMTRGGLHAVVKVLGPHVATDDDVSDRKCAARLIALAVAYQDHLHGPLFGGGSAATEPSPPTQLIDDLDMAYEATRRNGGNRQTPKMTSPVKGNGGEPQARRLQVDVFVEASGKNKKVEHAFVAGRTHVVEISVGHGGSIQSATPFKEPDSTSAEGFEWLDIHVQTSERTALSSGRVKLPHDRSRNSDCFKFQLTVTPGAENLSVLITVLHRGRVLQSASLSGPVVSSIKEDRSPGKIEILTRLDVHAPDNLEDRSTFDATVVVDERFVTAITSRGLTAGDLRGVNETVEKITNRLFEESESIAIKNDVLDEETAIALLRYLAVKGRTLYTAFVKQIFPELKDAKSIQIIPTNASHYLPLEFVYTGREPTSNATLCANWVRALKTGECQDCLHDSDSGDRSEYICPLGFWSLSKLIERHAVSRTESGQEFRVGWNRGGGRKTLHPLRRAIWSASDKVSDVDILDVGEFLKSVSPGAEEVLSWKKWLERVKDYSPTLLVSMPHNAYVESLDVSELQLSRGPGLRVGEVSNGHVHDPEKTIADEDRPVILMLGCKTGQSATHPYLTFVGGFRISGAALVIGTLSSVLAKHSPPMVKEILCQIASAGQTHPGEIKPRPTRLGELMLRARQELFARGFVVALGVVAFGDADWRIEG